MNRTTVVFLALAILVAHTLAIHQTDTGGFAAPYDRAHVSYRLGRNLVHEGAAAWDPSPITATSAGRATPNASPAWIWVSAAAEYLRLAPTRSTQGIGILLSLLTIVVLAQFSAERLAGLIAPVLFAASGSTAAAAASGTEAPLAMLLGVSAYLALQRSSAKALALVLPLLVWTRPEGLPLALGISVLGWLDGSPKRGGPRSLRRSLVASWAVIVAGLSWGGWVGNGWLWPFLRNLLSVDTERWTLGAHYLAGFFVASATAPLLLLPAVLALLGRLRASGRRPLLLFLIWALAVGLSGGDALPFWNALAPALPFALLAIQTAISGWIDENPRHAPAGWGILVITMVGSLVVSMPPTSLGPRILERGAQRWMQPSAELARAYPRPMGRAGLAMELARTERMRALGIFLRDNLEPEARTATLWPGSIGYLSRKHVFDLLGRAQPVPGARDAAPWLGAPRVDLLEILRLDFDYLVPDLAPGGNGSFEDVVGRWLRRYDVIGDRPERLASVQAALKDYELVSVPVPISSRLPNTPSAVPFLLLRRPTEGQGAQLELRLEGRRFALDARHEGHRQIVHLEVQGVDREGRSHWLTPTGQWNPDTQRDARTHLLLYGTGTRSLRLVEGELPESLVGGTLYARLYTPGIAADSPLSTVGRAVESRVR